MQGTTPRGGGGLTQNQKLAAGAAAVGLAYYFYSRRHVQAWGVPAGLGVLPGDAAPLSKAEGPLCLSPASHLFNHSSLPLPAPAPCSQAKNVGDAASRAGAAAGRSVEAAGAKVRGPGPALVGGSISSSETELSPTLLLLLQMGSETLKEEGRGLQAKQQ